MALPKGFGDPTVVQSLVAQHIITTANATRKNNKLPPVGVDHVYLTEAVAEITPQTQTLGAALLQVTLNDPEWKIARSGICDQTPDGLLQEVDVNYPEGTSVWWRLTMVDFASVDAQAGQPNLTLTFQMRIVSYLIDCWGPLGWPSGHAGTTRAQFIKMLVDKMPSELPKGSDGPGSSPITFICPEIDVVQPLATSGTTTTPPATTPTTPTTGTTGTTTPTTTPTSTVTTPTAATNTGAMVNKTGGIGSGASLTVKGSPITSSQIAACNTLLSVGVSLSAPTSALIAIIYAAMGESDITTGSGGGGILQGISGDIGDAAEATAFFKGTGDWSGGGGALASAARGDPPWMIANEVENNAVWGSSRGDSYAGQFPGGQAQGISEATAIVNAFGGGGLGTTGAVGTTGTAAPVSDVSQLTRGTPDNPDEDSWTCMQRLAGEVNWSLFCDPSPSPGVYGNYMYFMSGPALVAQKPSLYISLSDDGTTWSAKDGNTGKAVASDGVVTSLQGTFDQTAFLHQETVKKKGKVQSKTRIRIPQTPTRVKFNMIIEPLDYNAGNVFVFQNASPLSGGTQGGRWIVEDQTQNTIQDLFAQFTLGPPTYPYPEPQGVSTASTTPAGVTVTPGGTGTYVNPFSQVQNLSPERIDMGVDYNGSGNILAIGNAKVVAAAGGGTGWTSPLNTQAGVVYQLTDGPLAGKFIYVTEDLTILVSTGQTIAAGTPIATFLSSSTGLETGWATGNSFGAVASSLGQYPVDGTITAMGYNFSQFLQALGAPPGVGGGPGNGSVPAGYYTPGMAL